MKKIKSLKKLLLMLCCVCIAACAFAFAACDDSKKTDDETGGGGSVINPDDGSGGGTIELEGNTTVFEFEDLDFTNKKSSGLSGAAEAWELVTKASGFGINVPAGHEASNGYFAGYTYEVGFTYEFEVTASAATSVSMILRMNSEVGILELSPNQGLAIKVNGVALNYAPVTVIPGEDVNNIISLHSFSDYKIAVDEIKLNEGANSVVFEILEYEVSRGQAAPLMDCMKLSTKDDVTLTFSNNYQEETHRGYEQ